MKPLLAMAALLAFSVPAAAQGGGDVPMKNPPKLTIKVTVEETPAKRDPKVIVRTYTGSGDAEYPNGTSVQLGMRMKDSQKAFIRVQGFVTDKHWSIKLPAYGDDIYRGIYIFQVDFDPELQPNAIMAKLPADKRSRNSTMLEEKVGTDEEINAEKKEVLEFYRTMHTRLKTVYATVSTEYQVQLKERNNDTWRKVSETATGELQKLDQDLLSWRKRRQTVMMSRILDSMGSTMLTLRDFLLESYSSTLANGGTPNPGQDPANHESSVTAYLDQVDKWITAGGPPEPVK